MFKLFFIIILVIGLITSVFFFLNRKKVKDEINKMEEILNAVKANIESNQDIATLKKNLTEFSKASESAKYYAERERIFCNMFGGRGDLSSLFYYKDCNKINNLNHELETILQNIRNS